MNQKSTWPSIEIKRNSYLMVMIIRGRGFLTLGNPSHTDTRQTQVHGLGVGELKIFKEKKKTRIF